MNLIIQEELAPIRARRKQYEQYIPEVYKILQQGSKKARIVAARKTEEVKKQWELIILKI